MTRCGIVLYLTLSLTFFEFCQCYSSQAELLSRSGTARRLHEIGRRIRSFISWITHLTKSEDTFVGRCAGLFKRLRMTLTFIVFKLGVIVTTLFFLTLLAFKSIAIGVILIILTTLGLSAKFHALKHHDMLYPSGYGYIGHTAPQHQQPVYVHVHKGNQESSLVHEPSHAHESSYVHEPHYSPYSELFPIHRLDGLYPRNQLERSAVIDLYKRLGITINLYSNDRLATSNSTYR